MKILCIKYFIIEFLFFQALNTYCLNMSCYTFSGQFSMPKPLSPKTSTKPAQILIVNDESFAVVG